MARINVALRPFAAMDAAAMLTALSPDDHQRLATRPELRRRHMLTLAYRREVLATATGAEPRNLRMLTSNAGKPYLPDYPVSFNVSHTKTACVVAWSPDGMALGVDIEDRTRRPAMADIAATTFTTAEAALWEQSSQSPEIWLAIWTRKEALLKCHGSGLRSDLTRLDTGFPQGRHTVVYPAFGPMTLETWTLPDQLLSLAWQSGTHADIVFDY